MEFIAKVVLSQPTFEFQDLLERRVLVIGHYSVLFMTRNKSTSRLSSFHLKRAVSIEDENLAVEQIKKDAKRLLNFGNHVKYVYGADPEKMIAAYERLKDGDDTVTIYDRIFIRKVTVKEYENLWLRQLEDYLRKTLHLLSQIYSEEEDCEEIPWGDGSAEWEIIGLLIKAAIAYNRFFIEKPGTYSKYNRATNTLIFFGPIVIDYQKANPALESLNCAGDGYLQAIPDCDADLLEGQKK